MTGEQRVELLRDADLDVLGRLTTASNAAYLVRIIATSARGVDRDPTHPAAHAVDDIPEEQLAVYKPVAGERPLVDFPPETLHRREAAAWHVMDALGWGLVPPTVIRDGPYGVGSVQQFVAHDPRLHYFVLAEQGTPVVHERLRQMAVFDLIVNNADRKAGHVLARRPQIEDERVTAEIRLIDHGVCFHVEDKLRTVAWELAGSSLDAERPAVTRLVSRFSTELEPRLVPLLADDEIDALRARLSAVAALDVLPPPRGDRPYPWPLI
ncbi:MAG: SCO1664 family protein [Nitriliruptoraceae bacterium]